MQAFGGKPFSYYESLANIFGKDIATISPTKTPIAMAKIALQEEIHDDDNEIDDEGSSMSATCLQFLNTLLDHIHNHQIRSLNQMNILLLVFTNWFHHFTKPTLICLKICLEMMKIMIRLGKSLL